MVDLIIFPVILQTDINVIMLAIGRQGRVLIRVYTIHVQIAITRSAVFTSKWDTSMELRALPQIDPYSR